LTTAKKCIWSGTNLLLNQCNLVTIYLKPKHIFQYLGSFFFVAIASNWCQHKTSLHLSDWERTSLPIWWCDVDIVHYHCAKSRLGIECGSIWEVG
jgi:hypothetical protein